MKAGSWPAGLIWGLSLVLLVGYIPLRASSAVFGSATDTPLAPGVVETLRLSVITTVEDGFLHSAYLAFSTFGVLIVVFLLFEPRGLAAVWARLKGYFKTWPFSY